MKTTNTFADLMQNFAIWNAAKQDHPEKYEKALTDLATAVAYSVLKKCIDTSYNPMLVQLRKELTNANKMLLALEYSTDNATDIRYNDNGDLRETTTDRDLKQASATLASETLGDGLDLVNTAVVAILEECKKANDRTIYTIYDHGDHFKKIYCSCRRPDSYNNFCGAFFGDYELECSSALDDIEWLEIPYEIRRLKRKVWIKSNESVNGWETVETTPIQEIFKAVRRSIMNSRAAAADPRNGYSYISELATDPESGESCEIYRRLNKYADLGDTSDYAAGGLYSVGNDVVDRYDAIIFSLNLSKKQAAVLKLRERGYNNKAIATYLGVTENSVKGAMTQVKEKARAQGLEPSSKGEKIPKRKHYK